ncbi:hypothetical protein SeMB42_g01850 [Synchytrium endobioticum]|uniref:Uncharacterized protein n=1 Tax=Synchytrium endobioticum TaxID=286115 RepID=A0A507DLA0_9FUNG|nr:hypothetical protein SeMB42_g01850 [Synchytrium endobioticum]
MGDDLVPRLSLPALDKFRLDLYRVLTTCPLHKAQVLGSSIANYFKLTTKPLQALYASLPHRSDPTIPFETKPSEELPDMRLPGRIMYLVKERESGCFSPDDIDDEVGGDATKCRGTNSAGTRKKHLKKYVYAPRWASNEEFIGITVSWTMISDHFCFPVIKKLRESPTGRVLMSVSSTQAPRQIKRRMTRSRTSKQRKPELGRPVENVLDWTCVIAYK